MFGKDILLVVLLVGLLAGCVSGLVGPAQTKSDQADSQIGGADATEPSSLVGTLKEAFMAGAEAAKEEAEKTPAFQAGKKTTEGLLELLAYLGVGTGTVGTVIGAFFGLKKRKADKVATATVTAVQEARKDPAVARIFPAAVEAALSKLQLSKADYDAAIRAIKDKYGIASVSK